jgi:hypothetical protein
MQDWQQVLILSAPIGDFYSNAAKANPPLTQQEPLAGGNVFVEHQH